MRFRTSKAIPTFYLLTILTTGLLYCASPAKAGGTITVQGMIMTDSGKALNECYIKVTRKNSRQLLSFFNTGNSSQFSVTIPFSAADTFFITATHVGYQSTTVSLFVPYENFKGTVNITLPEISKKLKDVSVKASPVWVRGDTTFFNTDAFKEGDERKLKDLITKLPGFEIDETGNLLYKKKPVEKIMVEGDELFADKVKLLLANFPVHVLSNVQAIENQSGNKLLKGLANDNKVFVNLGLNKAKLKTAFGDGEVGVGTLNRYSFNPVLFSLYGKLKAGYIGNWNNTGNGISWQDEDKLKSPGGSMMERVLMHNNSIQTINNFSNSRYLRNRLWDNRLQINLPVSKKLKSSTEINFLKDQQQQNIYNRSVLYSDSFFFSRADTGTITHRPLYWSVNETIDWQPDSTRSFVTRLFYFKNGSTGNRVSIYKQTETDTSKNNYTDKGDSYGLSFVYTHRVADNKAFTWTTELNNNKYIQQAAGISSSWPLLFRLQDEGYNVLSQQLHNQFTTANTTLELILKTKKSIITTSIGAKWSRLQTGNNMQFNNTADTLPVLLYDSLSNKGRYERALLYASAKTGIRLFKKVFDVQFLYGHAFTRTQENGIERSLNNILYNAGIDKSIPISATIHASLAGSFSQLMPTTSELRQIILPTALYSFHQYDNVSQPIRTLNIQSYIEYLSFKTLISSNLVLTAKRAFSGFVQTTRYNGFVENSLDTLVYKPVSSFGISNNSTIPSLALGAKFMIRAGVNFNQQLLLQNGKLINSSNTFTYLALTIKKNLHKKYFIEISGDYSNSTIQLPEDLKGEIANHSADLFFTFKQRLVIKKTINLIFYVEWLKNNLYTPNRASFVLADAECNFQIPKSAFFVTIKAENITGQDYYYDMRNDATSQFFSTIPLIKRNVFVALRYQL